jgi:hypothetical protein
LKKKAFKIKAATFRNKLLQMCSTTMFHGRNPVSFENMLILKIGKAVFGFGWGEKAENINAYWLSIKKAFFKNQFFRGVVVLEVVCKRKD